MNTDAHHTRAHSVWSASATSRNSVWSASATSRNSVCAEKFSPWPSDPRYGVSRDGQVCRLVKIYNKRAAEIITPFINNCGYARVCVQRKFHFVHRLVAETYIPNPENKPEVAHYDGIRLNNVDTNLRWATSAENQLDKERHKTVVYGDTHGMRKIDEKTAKEIEKILATKIPFYPPFHWQIAEQFGVSRNLITNISIRKTWARANASR